MCLCVCALHGKAILEMSYTVWGGTFNPSHSLTHSDAHFLFCWAK